MKKIVGRWNPNMWNSLSKWDGFEHVASFADPKVHLVYTRLSNIDALPTTTAVLPLSFQMAEMLNTVAYFVVCLGDKGMGESASWLARRCITAVLNLSVPDQSAEEHRVEAETAGSTSSDVLHEIAECHKEIAALLWSDQKANGVGNALIILFQAVEGGEWGWSTKQTYNLKPWLTPLKGETILHELMESSTVPFLLETSPAMLLALLCVMTSLNTAASTIVQVSSKKKYSSCLYLYRCTWCMYC